METSQVPFGYIKEGKIFLAGWGDHPDREIGEVRDDDNEKSVQFFVERFQDLETKVNEVTEKIDSTENKGSFLMKLVHLREHLPTHDGLGDYPGLEDKLKKYESLVRDIIQKNRARNTELKTVLVEEAKQLEGIINWKEATEKAQELKTRWIKTGSAEEGKNEELEEAFWGMITSFFERKKQFFEDKQKLTEHRKRKYEALVEEAKNVQDLHGKAKAKKVKELKNAWKETGGIPAEFYKPLNETFYSLLKPKGRFKGHQVNYDEILAELAEIKSDPARFDKRRVDALKKNIYTDKSRNDKKTSSLELIGILTERDFLFKIANKRFSDFPKLEKDKKQSIKVGILKELIQRDEEDLKVYEENSANFSSADGKMNKLVASKLKGQKNKIAIKSKLLDGILSGEF